MLSNINVFWFKLGGVLAVFLAVFGAGYWFASNHYSKLLSEEHDKVTKLTSELSTANNQIMFYIKESDDRKAKADQLIKEAEEKSKVHLKNSISIMGSKPGADLCKSSNDLINETLNLK